MESQLIAIAMTVATGVITGYLATKVTLAVAVNDINWLKAQVTRAHQRLDELLHKHPD